MMNQSSLPAIPAIQNSTIRHYISPDELVYSSQASEGTRPEFA